MINEGIATIVGALIGLAGTYLALVLPERKKRSSILADYLDGLTGTMQRMVDKFRLEQKPLEAGHYLDSALRYFENPSSLKLLSDDASQCIRKLRQLSAEADQVDGRLDRGDKALADSWIEDAERAIGETRAEAAKLRLG